MGFSILYHNEALKDLKLIKTRSLLDCEFIFKKIGGILSANPFPFGSTIKKLKGIQPTMYRLRINATQSYRVFYRIIGNSVFILKIVAKKDADKVLKRYF